MPNIFDQFDAPAAPAAPANIFDQFDPPAEQGSLPGNILRSAIGQGLMLSTGDEALAYTRSKFFGTPYEEELEKERGKLKQFREEYPIGSTAAEVVGGAALPVAGLAGAGGRLAAGMARAGSVGRTAAKPVGWVADAMTLKRGDSIGKTALAGGTTATAFGAPALFGAGEGGFEERAGELANLPLVAGIGTVAGPAARGIGGGLSAISRHITSSPEQIAFRRAAGALDDARIDPDEMISDIAPTNTRAKIKATPEQEETVISARLAGTPWAQIQKDTKLSAFVTQRIWRDFEAKRTRAPLNIMERAGLRGDQSTGAARPVAELGRAAANLPGKGQSIAFERSMNKQVGQRGRVEQLVDDTFGAEDYAPRVAAVEDRLHRQAGEAYDSLYAKSPVIVDDDLADVIVTPVAKPFWEKARALAAAEGRFIPDFDELAAVHMKSRKRNMGIPTTQPKPTPTPAPPVTPVGPIGFTAKPPKAGVPAVPPIGRPSGPPIAPTLTLPVRAIDYFQRALRLEAKGAYQSGRGAEGATAAAIRKRLLEVVDPRIAGYKTIREAYSEGKMAEEALALGRGFIARAGQRMDDTVKKFDKMTPEQKELFNIGLGQSMKDMVANKQATHDLTASMRTKAAQDAYRKVLGPEKANRFINDILQEAEITRSTRFLTEGSRTAPMQQAQAKLLEEEQFVSDVISLKPMGLISGTAKRMARALSEKNNAALVDILTTTDEGQMLRALREISSALKKEQKMVSGRVSMPAITATGIEIGKAQDRGR